MKPPAPPRCSEEELPQLAPLDEERIAQIAKALAHPERVRILAQFESREIVGESDLAQSTVSEHLRILREADLVFARKDGPRTWYCLRRSVLRTFAEAVDGLTREPAVHAYM